MAMMMQMSGAELDRMFLSDMIAHHAGALSMSHRAMPYLQRNELKTMAQNIFDSQAREIGDIHSMLQGQLPQ